MNAQDYDARGVAALLAVLFDKMTYAEAVKTFGLEVLP